MSVSDAITVSFESYQNVLTNVSPETVICVRGRHAIGKSEGVYQAAAKRRNKLYRDPEFCARMVQACSDPTHGAVKHATGWKTEWTYEDGVPVVERRLSQMTEGDMIGMPFKSQMAGVGQDMTEFVACDWVIQSCQFPVVLFLDERNRALEGVKQAVFQLADSKAFYGNRLHPGTFIVVAENVGDAYQVQQNDPAEISRYVTMQLEPTREEFMEYAEKVLHEACFEFLQSNMECIEYTGVYEPNKKYPDRRSWVKFSAEGSKLGLFDEDEPSPLLRVLAGGHLGVETGAQFYRYCQERERQVKADDVLANWSKVKRRLSRGGSIPAEKYVEIVNKLDTWLKNGKPQVEDGTAEEDENNRELTDAQAENLAAFMRDCPAEPRMACWALLQRDATNLFKVHPLVLQLMVATATGEDMENLQEQPAPEEPRSRGRK